MFRSFAQTVFVLTACCLLLMLDCLALRAQEFNGPNAAAAVATVGGTTSDKPLPDISGLVRESDLHGASMHRQLYDYTYSLRKTKRTLNERGKVVHELVQSFEAFPVSTGGQHVLVQVSENGAALPSWRVAYERKRAGEQLEKIESEAQQRLVEGNAAAATTDEPGRQITAGIYGIFKGKPALVLIDLSDLLRSCEFSSPRRERVGTREVLISSFHPRSGLELPADKAFISKLNGTVWIDTTDKVVMRLEGWPVQETVQGNAAAATPETNLKQPEPSLVYQQVRLPTGVWVPSLIRMNAAGNGALFNGLNWDVLFEFTDYKRYSTDVGGFQFEKPKEQP